MQGNDPNESPTPPSADEDVRARIAKAPLSPFRLPTDTTPTWEVELLLSGGTLFALMQIPGWLGDLLQYWEPRVGEGPLVVLGFGVLFAKVIVFSIVTALITHLLTRGLWVAAIGLRSVYPGGIRWRGVRHGARYRAVVGATIPTLKRIIDRSDDLASQMFAVAALLVVMTLYSVVGTLLVLGGAWAISSLLLKGEYLTELALGLVTLLAVSQPLAVWADRRAKVRGRGRRARLRGVAMVMRANLSVPFARLSHALMLVFTSHFGSVRGTIVLMLVMYSLIGIATADMVFARDGAKLGPGAALHGLVGERVVDDAHYADRRSAGVAHALKPYIPSAQPQGDYLQLVIPFHPRKHPQALEFACPGALQATASASEALQSASKKREDVAPDATALGAIEAAEAAQRAALDDLLACVARLHAPRLDGTPISGAEMHLLDAADAGQPAFAAWLPLHGIAQGRHVLELNSLREPDSTVPLLSQRTRAPRPPVRIPFWR